MHKHILFASALLLSTAAGAQSLYPGQFDTKVKAESQGKAAAKCMPLNEVTLLPSRFRENMQRDSAWMMNIDVNRLLHSFYTNAGVFAGREGGYMTVKKYGGWESLDCELRGHTTGHLMSAYALMYASTGSPEFKLKGDSIVAGLKKVQDVLGNGYVSAFPEELINRNIRGESVWAPWYTLHKILSGLIDQYLYCDNTDALVVATKLGDWIYNKLSPLDDETRRRMIRNEFGGINDALYALYSLTANEHYREMAEFFYHNDVIDPLKQHNGDMGTKHTNTFIPKTIAEIRRYELLGDEASLDLSRFFWDEMMAHHTFPTGSLSDKEHYFNPEQFSKHITGYTGETCCTYNMLKLARHLFCNEPSAKYADYMETAIYNHILGQQDPQSGMVCYFLPLATGSHRVYSTPENSFWCCVGSGFESHAKYGESIYFQGDNELYVNLFIASKLNWEQKGLTVTQSTTFPYADRASLSVNVAKPTIATIKLRCPQWAENPVLSINGKKVSSSTENGYFVINRKWRNGDKVELTLPTSVRCEAAPDDSSKVVLLYGPIVLAGRLGTEGMQSPAPFSNPALYNDYYTYNFNIPSHLKDIPLRVASLNIKSNNTKPNVQCNIAGQNIQCKVTGLKQTAPLTWQTADGITVSPFYDIHRERYVVYWSLPSSDL
jgi:DUF1680 family protein